MFTTTEFYVADILVSQSRSILRNIARLRAEATVNNSTEAVVNSLIEATAQELQLAKAVALVKSATPEQRAILGGANNPLRYA